MKNRAEKRRAERASLSERASATDRQRAFRARAHDPRRRSRPLRVVIACAFIGIMVSMTILPSFAASANTNQPTYDSLSNVEAFSVQTSQTTWDFTYNQTVVGTDPQSFSHNQRGQSIIYGPSAVIFNKIKWNDTITLSPLDVHYDDIQVGEVRTRILKLPSFISYTQSGDVYKQHNAIKLEITRSFDFHAPHIENIYYGIMNGDEFIEQHYAYNNGWRHAFYKRCDFIYRYNELIWGTDLEGAHNYQWLINNATIYASSGEEADWNLTQPTNPFSRRLLSTMEAEIISENIVKGTSRYNIRRYWQSGGEDNGALYIRFRGNNVVVPDTKDQYIPYIHELPDNWTGALPKVRTTATIHYYRVTYTAPIEPTGQPQQSWTLVTKEYDSGWKSATNGNMNLYPSISDIFGTEISAEGELVAERITGMIISEYETTLYFPSIAVNDNWRLLVTDYYFKDEAKEARLVYNYMTDANFPTGTTTESISTLGKFLAKAVGGFFDTPLIGVFSIGDIMMVIIGIGLVIVFLKIFAGG